MLGHRTSVGQDGEILAFMQGDMEHGGRWDGHPCGYSRARRAISANAWSARTRHL